MQLLSQQSHIFLVELALEITRPWAETAELVEFARKKMLLQEAPEDEDAAGALAHTLTQLGVLHHGREVSMNTIFKDEIRGLPTASRSCV